ncbi:MAG: dipeptidase [Clostridiales bacterium]|nr:dipeptidase [Clostridiales bacterium]
MLFPIADAHCDFLFGAMRHGWDLATQRREQVTCLPYLQGGNVALQCFAVWADQELRSPPMLQAMSMIDSYHRMLEKFSDVLAPLTRDFDPNGGKIATVLTAEGGEICSGSLAVLRDLYRLGVRMMTLTWNESNELAGAATDRRAKGLTALGREFLAEMNRLGIALDVSHLSAAGIDDALTLSRRPILASHSNAHALCPVPRCLRDEHIRAIAQQGGVIGVNFYAPQLVPQGQACIDDIVRHILHIVSIGGIDCCCFGSDFDGMPQYPRDLKNALDFQRLCRALLTAGFSEAQVRKIAYENLQRFLAQFV